MTVTRKYFGTDGIRGRTGVHPITAEFALKLGWAAGQVLSQDGKGTVVIGKDTRVSGYMLASALEAGLTAAGLDVYLLGDMPTPGVAFLAKSLDAKAGIVVSASHNPYYDNGIKFFSGEGQKLPDAIESKIESLLQQEIQPVAAHQYGRAKTLPDAPGRYIEFCKSTFCKPYDLKGIKIVIDCANGATSHIAPHVFTELGADVIALHHQPDGFNINDQRGSTHPQALQKAVIQHQAEVGIALDGDGDRLIMVDHKGQIVDGDECLYVIAMSQFEQNCLKGGVVGTLMSNLGLEKALTAKNILFARTKVGDRYVMDAMRQKGWNLGGETSGHIICLDKTSTGDGIICALQVLSVLCQANRSLHELKQGMNKCAQILLNVTVANGMDVLKDPRIEIAYRQAQQDLFNKGRIILRASGTEPLVRVMVEGEDNSLIRAVAQNVADAVEQVARIV